MALLIADALFWLKNKVIIGLREIGRLLLVPGKYAILPIILFIYKNVLLTKIRLKNFNFGQLKYLVFLKKYLPSLIIVAIITIATSHNILAKNYTAEEYVNHTLLPTIININNEEGWSELVEDNVAAQITPGINNYLDQQGNLQELSVATPFAPEADWDYGDVTSDSSSLVENVPGANAEIPAQQVPARSETITYTIQSGDVLGQISQKFGISVNTILWENGLTIRSTIKPGQILRIPPGSGLNYTIKSGDTLAAIAKKYQGDVQKIVAANDLSGVSDIKIGKVVFIPNGVKPTSVVSAYSTAKKEVATSFAKSLDFGTKLLWPLISSRMTQYFSWRHPGLDIGDKTGEPIYAADDGKVEISGWNRGGYGYYVVINHGNGIKTLYGHASKLLVSAGDVVSRGQTIALIGSTGRSTGPHLHFEVRVNGSRDNPLNYIK